MKARGIETPAQQIITHGDELDMSGRARAYGQRAFEAGLGATTAAVAFMDPSLTLLNAAALAAYYPVIGSASAAASFGLKRLVRREIRSVSTAQQSIRDELGESVDLLRTPMKKGGSVLRWYGLDLAEEPADDAGRLEKIITYAEANDIPRVAFGADRLQLPESKPVEQFGALLGGKDMAVLKAGKTRRTFRVEDSRLDDKMLVCTTEQAKNVVEHLRSKQNQTTLARLVAMTGSESLLLLLNQVHAGKESKLTLFNTAQRMIANVLDGDVFLDTMTSGSSGDDIQGVVKQSYTVVGQSLLETGEFRPRNGDPREGVGGKMTTITRFLGVDNKDTLVDRVLHDETRTPVQRQKDAIFAVYLLLHDESNKLTNVAVKSIGSSRLMADHTTPPSTLSLLYTPKGKVSTDNALDRTVELRLRRNIAKRVGMKVVRSAAAMALGFGMQYPVMESWNLASAKTNEACQQELAKQNAGKMLQPCGNTIIRTEAFRGKPELQAVYEYRQVLRKANSLDTTYLANVADVLRKAGLANVIPRSWFYGAQSDGKAAEVANKMTPLPNANKEWFDDYAEIGDVSPTVNRELYHITSLSGKSSNGYWYTDVNNNAELKPVTINGNDVVKLVFTRGRIRWESNVEVPYESSTIEALKPDFSVDIKSYHDSSYGIMTFKMPVLAGYSVVGMQLVDETNPSISVAIPNIFYDKENQGYYATFYDETIEAFSEAGGKTPVIRYYLKETGQKTVAMSRFTFLDGYEVVDGSAVAIRVKKALGLPADAPNAVVENAISSKYYSYTPIATGKGLTPYANVSNSADEFASIGENLASYTSMNCNLATATLLLATDGEGGSLNQANGYRNNGDDYLTNLEAHSWAVNDQGAIVDVTPSTVDPDSPIPPSVMESAKPDSSAVPIMPISLAVLGLAGAGLAYLKRAKIIDITQAAAVRSLTTSKRVPGALSVADQILYARPGSVVELQSSQGNQPVSKKLALHYPEGFVYSEAELRAIAAKNNIDISNVTKDIWNVLRMLHATRSAFSAQQQDKL